MRFLLALRAILAVVLLPGTVAGFIPYGLLRSGGDLRLPEVSVTNGFAAGVLLAGIAVLLRCVWDFFASGRGTLAPIDPPKSLVVAGLYRHTRNPMYNGVLAIVLAQAGLFRSTELAVYAAVVFLSFHLFVLIYEEPTLEALFGADYQAYRQQVPRWGFRLKPYLHNAGNTRQ